MIVVKAHRRHLDTRQDPHSLSFPRALRSFAEFARRFYLVNCAREHERLATPPPSAAAPFVRERMGVLTGSGKPAVPPDGQEDWNLHAISIARRPYFPHPCSL